MSFVRSGAAVPAALAITLVLAAVAAAQTTAGSFTPGAETPEDLPAGTGREETFYACTACHNFKLVAAQGMTRAQWDESLTWMTSRHKMEDIQGVERDVILNYLEKHFAPRAPSRAGGFRNPFAPQ